MSQLQYKIKTSKQYDRDVKLAKRRGLNIDDLLDIVRLLRDDQHCRRNAGITCSMVTTKASGSATSIPTGYSSMRRTRRYASSPSPARGLTLTSLAAERKDECFLGTYRTKAKWEDEATVLPLRSSARISVCQQDRI